MPPAQDRKMRCLHACSVALAVGVCPEDLCAKHDAFVCMGCAPVLQVLTGPSGEPHIAFFARTPLRAGQELTFDYRFREEADTHKVRCQCGAPNCKVRAVMCVNAWFDQVFVC